MKLSEKIYRDITSIMSSRLFPIGIIFLVLSYYTAGRAENNITLFTPWCIIYFFCAIGCVLTPIIMTWNPVNWKIFDGINQPWVVAIFAIIFTAFGVNEVFDYFDPTIRPDPIWFISFIFFLSGFCWLSTYVSYKKTKEIDEKNLEENHG